MEGRLLDTAEERPIKTKMQMHWGKKSLKGYLFIVEGEL
jgi:hypothetical protein